MESILEKISSYNLFNYLFPGAIFCIVGQNYLSLPPQGSIVEELFIYYFTGLVISRIGSLAVEPALRKVNFLIFADYSSYLNAVTKDPKIDILSTENNMYRSLVATFVALGGAKLFLLLLDAWPALQPFKSHIAIMSLLCLFLFSYRKQTRYIVKRIQSTTHNKE